MQNKTTILGFLLFIIGSLAFILTLIGVDLVFLKWLNVFGNGVSFMLKLLMAFGGVILIYISRADFEAEEDEYTKNGMR